MADGLGIQRQRGVVARHRLSGWFGVIRALKSWGLRIQ